MVKSFTVELFIKETARAERPPKAVKGLPALRAARSGAIVHSHCLYLAREKNSLSSGLSNRTQ